MESPMLEMIYKKIAKRTGLEKREDLEAYAHFCHHADFEDGSLLWGDVEHDFYEALKARASEPMKRLECVYYNAVRPRLHSSYRLRSPLKSIAWKRFSEAYHSFIEKGLIELPKTFVTGVFDPEGYPRLVGYNYFNDPEFYVGCKQKGERRFTERISVPLSEERRAELESKGSVFSD